MTKKRKQSKKESKSSKRTKVAAPPEEEPYTVTTFSPAEARQATPATPENEVTVESQLAEAAPAPTTESQAVPKATRSETAKANIQEGLKQHALAGRPAKAQLILVFGQKGYAMTWPQRTERFGITPETFQARWQRVCRPYDWGQLPRP
jgi:hypothetical protein